MLKRRYNIIRLILPLYSKAPATIIDSLLNPVLIIAPFSPLIDGVDYSGLPGTLSFTPTTDRTQCLTIQIENDDLSEQTETILLLLSDTTGGSPVTPAQATVFIIDDDDGMLEMF